MAKVLGNRTRGRKVEPFRLTARELAVTVAASGTTKSGELATRKVKVDVGDAEPLTITVPKGAIVLPVALTASKQPNNVNEQMRLAARDVGIAPKTLGERSIRYALDDEAQTEGVIHVWTMADEQLPAQT